LNGNYIYLKIRKVKLSPLNSSEREIVKGSEIFMSFIDHYPNWQKGLTIKAKNLKKESHGIVCSLQYTIGYLSVKWHKINWGKWHILYFCNLVYITYIVDSRHENITYVCGKKEWEGMYFCTQKVVQYCHRKISVFEREREKKANRNLNDEILK